MCLTSSSRKLVLMGLALLLLDQRHAVPLAALPLRLLRLGTLLLVEVEVVLVVGVVVEVVVEVVRPLVLEEEVMEGVVVVATKKKKMYV
jgi:hypothetical protein